MTIANSLLTLVSSILFIGCVHAAEQRNPPDGVWAIDLEVTSKNVPATGIPSMQTICAGLAKSFFPLMQVLEVEGATAWYSVLGMYTGHKITYQLAESQGNTLIYTWKNEGGYVRYLNLTHDAAGNMRVLWGNQPEPGAAEFVWRQQSPRWLANEKMDLSAAVDRRYAVFSKLCPHDTK